MIRTRARRARTLAYGATVLGVVAVVAGAVFSGSTLAAYQDQAHARTNAIAAAVTTPFTPGISKNVRMVDTGLGLSNDGNVYVWGRTDMAMAGGAAGTGTDKPPTKVPGMPDGGLTAVTGGIYNINALDRQGEVWGWGYYNVRDGTDAAKPADNPQRVRIGSAWNGGGAILNEIVAISSTEYAGAGIRADGTVWHWGSPTSYGGNAGAGASRLMGLPDPAVAGNRPVYLKGAYTNFFVILENGDVYYWGGAAGTSSSLPSALPNVDSNPALVSPLSSWMRKNVAAGEPYVVAVDGGIAMGGALLSNGQVLSWGVDSSRIGARGTGPWPYTITPGIVPALSNIVSLQFGFTGVALLDNTNRLWGYGASDDYGKFPQTPTVIDTNVVQYGSGQGYYLWQKSDNTFWGRGYNPQGSIGLPSDNTSTNRQVSWDLGMVAR
ncbi:hypothetical protein [Luethyella okanaganae]|uniref:Alpha-tubulin suppressor-like RCC1 family protein n=1 Tax=Luethyella okanaganae TaxID=69372 RepID=A0ABW1VEE5_9MICO